MPKLIIPSATEGAAGPSPKVIAQYRRFIDRLPEKQLGFLKFSGKENIKEGREALIQAAAKSKKYVKIRKARGQDKTLQLQRCSKAEFDKSQKLSVPSNNPKRARKPSNKNSKPVSSLADDSQQPSS